MFLLILNAMCKKFPPLISPSRAREADETKFEKFTTQCIKVF